MVPGVPNQNIAEVNRLDFEKRFKSAEKYFKYISWVFYTATLDFLANKTNSHILKIFYYISYWKIFMISLRYTIISLDNFLKMDILSFIYKNKYAYYSFLLIIFIIFLYANYIFSSRALPSLINSIANIKKS